tara:strand:- start:386 stop:796 length:411 start_codon:yes stop_codon:yes gene_type:complete
MPNFKKNQSPFMMKSSPAKMWPWGKTTRVKKDVTDESGQTYRVVDKTRKRGDVTVTKHSTQSYANFDVNPDLWVKKSKVKKKDGKVISSKHVTIDEGGKKYTKTRKYRSGKTKEVVKQWDPEQKTWSKSKKITFPS